MIGKCQNPEGYLTYGQMNLINEFRTLWADLAVFMRSYIISLVAGIDGLTTATSNRLYHIPEDFKIKLQPFLGVDSAEQFQQLLQMFITSAQVLIAATLNNDAQTVNETIIRLYHNIDEMSDLMAKINPYWDKTQWQNLFYKLIEMGVSEVSAFASGDYERELQILGDIIQHTLKMGDYTASGLINYLSPGYPQIQ